MLDSSPDDEIADTTDQPAVGETPVAIEKTDDEDAGSSTAKSTDVAPDSSPEKPKTMLDAVKAAIKPKTDSSTVKTPGQAAEAETPASKAAKEAADKDLSPEEMASLSERTQRRFKKLTSDVKARDGEIARLTPRAAEYDKIDQFVRNAGLSNQEVSGTLEIAAMLRSSPREALARLVPIVGQLRQIVGETLDPDLQKQVDQGFLTEAHAKSLQRAQADAAFAQRQSSEMTQAQQQEQQRQGFKTLVDGSVSAAESWEKAKAVSDPDWSQKREEVAQGVELAILQESNRLNKKWFPNPEETVKLSEAALVKVNERFSRFTPKPRAITPSPTGGASTRSTPAPKTMLDVVRQTVARG